MRLRKVRNIYTSTQFPSPAPSHCIYESYFIATPTTENAFTATEKSFVGVWRARFFLELFSALFVGLRFLHPLRLLCDLGVREHRPHDLRAHLPPLLALWRGQVGGVLELLELRPRPLFAFFLSGGVTHLRVSIMLVRCSA